MAATSKPKILFVDDDKNLLAGIARQFRGKYEIETAESGAEGLMMLSDLGPYAVLIADMNMPVMDGLQFLEDAHKQSPQTVRMMLTGNADLETAIQAINEHNIFRFLVKPSHKMSLQWAIDAALEQHRLVVSEKALIEKTLKGSLGIMTDLLAIANPTAFSKSSRLRKYMRQMATRLVFSKPWQFELAGLLSQIGCIGIPHELLERVYGGEILDDSEKEIFKEHPQTARQLLEKIPRLETVAPMISNQLLSVEEYKVPRHAMINRPDILGGLTLKGVLEFDSLASQGFSKELIINKLRVRRGEFHPLVLKALDFLTVIETGRLSKRVDLSDLSDKMILAEEIRTKHGDLLAVKGQPTTISLRALLRNCSKKGILEASEFQVYAGDSNRTNEIDDEQILREAREEPSAQKEQEEQEEKNEQDEQNQPSEQNSPKEPDLQDGQAEQNTNSEQSLPVDGAEKKNPPEEPQKTKSES